MKEFYKRVAKVVEEVGNPQLEGGISALLVVHPPNRRRRDIDNLPKAIFDSLKHTKVFNNDANINRFDVCSAKLLSDGLIAVVLQGNSGP